MDYENIYELLKKASGPNGENRFEVFLACLRFLYCCPLITGKQVAKGRNYMLSSRGLENGLDKLYEGAELSEIELLTPDTDWTY